MKALLQALVPIVLVVALVFVLVSTSSLEGRFSFHSDRNTEPEPVESEGLETAQPSLSGPDEEHTPRALPIDEHESAQLTEPPYVGFSYTWKLNKRFSKKQTIRFNDDGSVEQNFQAGRMKWQSAHQYSLILKGQNGEVFDVSFDDRYKTITGRQRGGSKIYVGKIKG